MGNSEDDRIRHKNTAYQHTPIIPTDQFDLKLEGVHFLELAEVLEKHGWKVNFKEKAGAAVITINGKTNELI